MFYDQVWNDIGFVIATKLHHYLGTVLPKSFTGALSSNSRLDAREVEAKSVRALSGYFGMKFLWLEIR